MKKILSVLLIMTIMLLSCGMMASAVSNNAGADALRGEFKAGDYIYDYYYYSPVKNTSDKTKYPVILWLHGQLSGDYKGHQIRQSEVVYLASDENQAKIKGTRGAYVLVPRFPTLSFSQAWDGNLSSVLTGGFKLAWTGESANLKKFVDKFISENRDNIDTDRIYVGGYSMGGKAAMKFAATYPNYVAALFPTSSIYLLASAESDLRSLINTPTWFFTCQEDDFWGKPTPESDDWTEFCKISNRKDSIRWTQFTMNYGNDTGLLNYDGTRIKSLGYTEHNAWDPVLHDLVMLNGSIYPNIVSTVDGNNSRVTLTPENSFLSWLSSQSLSGTIGDDSGNSGSGGNQSGGNSSSSGRVFYHVREILEYIITLFDRMYKALFVVI